MPTLHDILSSVEQKEKQRAEKRAKFLELLHDPDVADIVALVVKEATSQNGHQIERVRLINQQPPNAPSKPGVRTGLKEAIRNLELPLRFTSNDVLQLLNSTGFQFPDQEDVKGSVRDALLSLRSSNNPEIRIVVRGRANAPNVYEWIKGK